MCCRKSIPCFKWQKPRNSKDFYFPAHFLQEKPTWKHSQDIFQLVLLRTNGDSIYPDLLKILEITFLSLPPKYCFFLFFPCILSFYSHPKKFTIFAHHLIIFWYYLDFLFLAFLNISIFFTSVSNIVFLTSCFIYLFFCTHQKVHICSGTNSKPHHKMMLYDMFKVVNWESHQCVP